MLQYITLNTSWEKLTVDDSITFHTPDGSFYRYIIANPLSTYFCHAECGQNQIIFDILEIDAENFVKNVVGYIGVGSWPEVKTIDDLKKVIKALDDECIKKWGIPNKNTPQFKVVNKVKILDRDVSSFRDSIERVHDMFVDSLSCAKEEPQTETELNLFPEKKHYQLNFNY